MLAILENRDDFKAACERAAKKAVDEKCTVYVAYIASSDKFKVSDWFDDATVCKFDGSDSIEWV